MKKKCAKRASHKIEVVMPYHCSEIQSILQLNHDVYDDDTGKCSSSNFDDADHVNPVVVPVLVLHEGVMWRGLCPLFNLVVQRGENRNEQYKRHQQQQQDSICREKIVYSPSYSRVLKRRRRFFYEWLRRGISNNNNNAESLPVAAAAARITLLPPYTSSPDFYTCSLFITWEHILIRLQSLQAFTSTLGGGYFFCGQLHVAIELARYQRKLALALRDDHVAGICTVVSLKRKKVSPFHTSVDTFYFLMYSIRMKTQPTTTNKIDILRFAIFFFVFSILE
jgi:hypothetical protein